MKAGQKLWTREELILAINLYSKLPFGKFHKSNPEVIALANLIGRTPSSVGLKLGNLASFDPMLQARGVKGATNASKLDRIIWDEFYGNIETVAFESELLRANKELRDVGDILATEPDLDDILSKGGEERERIVKMRVNQWFFRKMVLSAYDNTCCITGITSSELLVAGHIQRWADGEKNRMNPHNGLAINALHDKAYEQGLITITPNHIIKVSPKLKGLGDAKRLDELFFQYDGKPIHQPKKFWPDGTLLKEHYEQRFQG
ncbi:MAG: HNH endonuclease [Flavobacteriales bacterium]|nr:HNH endonuclease [Flavobacteriales bacterium]